MKKELEMKHEWLVRNFSYDRNSGDFVRINIDSKFNKPTGKVLGRVGKRGYVEIYVGNGRYFYAHRLAWFYVYGIWPKHSIDHINGVPTDNRIANLRDLPIAENIQNVVRPRSSNTSGYLGVTWSKAAKKWQANVKLNGKCYYFGIFVDAKDAHAAYIEGKRKLHSGCTL